MPTSADLALDTSAALALVQPLHPFHEAVQRRCTGHRLALAGHAAFEFFSVLTRLPVPQRVDGVAALALVERNFSVVRASRTELECLRELVESRIVGGAVHDGLVALAAREAGIPLLSCDARASGTYLALHVPFELVR